VSYVDKVYIGKSKMQVKFRARWRDPSGKQRAKTFDRRAEAVAFLVKIDAAKAVGNYVDPQSGKMLVKDYAAEWLAGRDVRPSTGARAASLFRSHILPHLGEMPIGAVRPADVAAWKVKLLESKAPATVSKALTLLKAMLTTATNHGLLPTNPITSVKPPRVEREEMRFLTPEEIIALADAIDSRYRALVLVGAYGGLRIGELAGLQVSDLEMLKGTISVERQVVETAGKLTIGPLKTKASRRKVKVPRFVIEAIGPVGDGLVFPAPNGGLLSRTAFRARFWVPATKRAGLEGVRVHDLRHTAVALWIAAGASARQIADRAGHTSASFVLDRYGHLLPDADDLLVDRLEQMAAVPSREGQVIHLDR
jgi:integrase